MTDTIFFVSSDLLLYLFVLLIYNLHSIKLAETFLKLWKKYNIDHFHHFKAYNSEALSTFMMLYKHQQYLVPEFFITLMEPHNHSWHILKGKINFLSPKSGTIMW